SRKPPGRKRRGAPSRPRMVDSTPTAEAPPSITAAMRPDSPARTWSARVGETLPEGLAEGAANGPPKVLSRARATGWAGTRRATVGKPAVAKGERPEPSRKGSTKVRGPGQKASAKAR